MFYNWNQWVGQTVSGKFPLVKNLGCSDHSAAFLTERREGDRLHPATIKLIPALPESSEQQLSWWRLAAGLSHPRLIRLFESGKCELGDARLLYVVTEYADENLASVLPERALTSDETRAMLEAVVEALAYVHGKGFVHGHIKPANIMAHGEELKITSDSLCRTGESQNTPSAPDDVWSIGETLVEALTQRPPLMDATEPVHPLVPLNLPEPFNDIARHCLLEDPASRWTVAEIADRLKGRSAVSRVPQSQVSPTRTPIQPAKPEPVQIRTPIQSQPPRPSVHLPQGTDLKRNNYGAYVGAAVVLAAIVAGPWLFLRHHPKAGSASPAPKGQETRIHPEATPQKSAESAEARPTAPAPPPASSREERNFASATPLAAADGSKTPNLEGAKAEVGTTARLSVTGKVLQQVLPNVPQAARNTIHGTVKVTVRVDVDHSGRVEDAEIEARGPSKYFAQLALEAAQRWQFTPPKVAGQNAMSTWALRFEFTKAETTATPAQEIP
jgi:TonB family protein